MARMSGYLGIVASPRRVTVARLGEQRLASNGSVVFLARSGNAWQDTWTLRDGGGRFLPHEYAEFRCAFLRNEDHPRGARVTTAAARFCCR